MEQTSKTSVLIFSVFALTRWTGGRLFFKPPAPGPQNRGRKGGQKQKSPRKAPVKQNAIRMQGRADPEDGLPEPGHGHPAPDADKARSSSGSAVHRSRRKHGAARTHALRTDYKRIRRPIKGTCAEAN
ncbi:hypothetical protein ABTW24_00005 [Sphingobacterium thalpophilum]|uniref:Secreted protein n=1 Tax=Sphingobacterium thalpophilum TaxID=259 RepID=A0ABV4H8P2_9SPHI